MKYVLTALYSTAVLLTILILAVWVLPARSAEPLMYNIVTLPCTETKVIETDLANNYQEIPLGGGINPKNHLIRLFKSGKTFTIVETDPNGISCILSNGENWETDKPPVAGDKT